MAQKNAFDVWITAANTVYKAVPYNVVTDWVTQGRLLADDRLKLTGTEQWVRLGDTAAFSTFLPRVEPDAVGDQAEALESVENEMFEHSHAGEGEDEDVDMIPLIDISLVLLVFFMMTATIVSETLNVPKTKYIANMANPKVWVKVEPRPGSPPVYSIGEGDKPALPDHKNLSDAQLFKAVEGFLNDPNRKGGFDVRIVADTDLPIEAVQRVIDELSRRKKDGIGDIRAETTEAGGQKP